MKLVISGQDSDWLSSGFAQEQSLGFERVHKQRCMGVHMPPYEP